MSIIIKRTITTPDTQRIDYLPQSFATYEDAKSFIIKDGMDEAWDYFMYGLSEREKGKEVYNLDIDEGQLYFKNKLTNETWKWEIGRVEDKNPATFSSQKRFIPIQKS